MTISARVAERRSGSGRHPRRRSLPLHWHRLCATGIGTGTGGDREGRWSSA
ncbi:MAG: hypothetical protein AB7T14_09145 [Candidatus Methylacidiphilaceae bacterium]